LLDSLLQEICDLFFSAGVELNRFEINFCIARKDQSVRSKVMNNSLEICDDEWLLRKTEGTYFLRIGDFLSKLNWSAGTYLDTQVFAIGNTKFKLRFIPNNVKEYVNQRSDENMGSFGVYLYNLSNFDVLADLKLSMGMRSMTMERKFLRHRECFGWGSFFTHKEMLNDGNGVVNKAGKLEVRAEITVNWERKVDNIQSLTTSDLLHGVIMELQKLKENIVGRSSRNSSPGFDVSKPSCSQCWKTPGTGCVLYQCVSGHIVCKTCYEGAKNVCGKCGEKMVGRAFAMEKFLETLAE